MPGGESWSQSIPSPKEEKEKGARKKNKQLVRKMQDNVSHCLG